jgi:F0F1-type ATP synthase epsilon subunit
MKTFKLTIQNTDETLFEGSVDRITSYNEIGRFDIYPMHANFISILNRELTAYNNHKRVKELKFEQAIMKVKQDVVNIFLGIEVLLLDKEGLNT